ncbi:hypothetical protein LJC40_02200 [Synergistaceae bacterium OttesenSCG-928-D05]|nr:hypothetical protein [Synergistaceae bacterium OttesenSCG-928-D05]
MLFLLTLLWLLQDFIQVFVMGIFLVPDIFLLSLILLVVLRQEHKDRQIILIWIAFFGGLFWDFRWTNLPGLTAAFNGGAVAAVAYFWYKAPVQGRTTILFAFYAVMAQALSGVLHYVFWNVESQVAIRQFLVQQLMSVPVLVILCLIFWRSSNSHV